MIEVEAESGFLVSSHKNSTFVLTVECSGRYNCFSLPFPDFDTLLQPLDSNGMSFPVYDQSETITVDDA